MIQNVPLASLALALSLVVFPAGAQQRWIVDAAASDGGDGSQARPFQTLAAAERASNDGDTIVLRAGAYPGGIALKSSQTIASEGAAVIGTISIANTTGTVTIRDIAMSGLIVNKAARVVVAAASVASVDTRAIAISDADLDATFVSVSARGDHLRDAILLQRTTGRFAVVGKDEQPGSGGTIEGARARAVSVIDSTDVTLRLMRLTGTTLENGAAPSACGSGNNEKCNAAVYLRNVAGVTLDGILIDGSKQAGLVAHRVRDLRIVKSEIRNAGDETFEHGVVLQEVSGDSRITASKIHHNASRQLMLRTESGTLKLTITGTTFSDGAAPHGQQGALITTAREASIDVDFRDCSFARNHSHGLDVIAEGTSRVRVIVSNTSFDRNASAISVSADESAAVDYTIADNPSILRSSASAINLFLGSRSRGRLAGMISRNMIGTPGVAGSGTSCSSCSGIRAIATGHGSIVAAVTENIIQQVSGSGIYAGAGEGHATLNLTVRANLLRGSADQNAPAIRLHSGTLPTDATTVCGDIGGNGAYANTVEGDWEPSGAIHLVHRFGSAQFKVAGLSGGTDDNAAAKSVASRNRGIRVRAALRGDAKEKGFTSVERCTMPSALTP